MAVVTTCTVVYGFALLDILEMATDIVVKLSPHLYFLMGPLSKRRDSCFQL